MKVIAAAVVCSCLLLTACGAKPGPVRVAAASPLPPATASTPSPGTASSPSRTAESAPSPVVVSAPPSQAPAPAAAPKRSARPTPGADHGTALWDTQWRAVERTRGGKPWPFPDGEAWTARFSDATARVLGWRGACNSTGASVVVSADRLMVSEPQGSTAVACDEPRMDEDQQANAFFTSDPTWSRRGDTLLLTSGETSVRLTRTTE